MEIKGKKFSLIVIIISFALLGLQFNNCESKNNPTQSVSTSASPQIVTPSQYIPPAVPEDTPEPFIGMLPPDENACNNYDFIDDVIDDLRYHSHSSRSWRYGYYCPIDQDCITNPNQISKVNIAYCKKRIATGCQGSSEISVVQILNNCNSNPQFTWNVQTDREGTWIYHSRSIANVAESPRPSPSPIKSPTPVACGKCGSKPNTCSVGTLHPHPGDNATHHRWTCRNKPHTKNAKCSNKREIRCSKKKPVSKPVACGKCGSKPNTCSVGTLHPHPGDNATHHRWTCRNKPHTKNAKCSNKREIRCSKKKPVSKPVTCGKCGSKPNTCSAGVVHPHPGANATHYRWTCRNKPHTKNAKCSNKREIRCSKKKPVSKSVKCGRCGSKPNTCSAGIVHPHPGANATHYRWTCRNKPHTKNAKCSNKREIRCSKKKPVSKSVKCGRCGSKPNTCSAGVVHPHPGANATHYRWTCRNKPHTKNAKCSNKREIRCSKKKPVSKSVKCGRCGSKPNTCSAGSHHPHPGANATHYRWTCRNKPHKRLAQCSNKREIRCSKKKPVSKSVKCGRCGSKANTCSAGSHHPHPGANATHYRWTCRNKPHTRLAQCGNKREVRCSKPNAVNGVCGECGNTVNACVSGTRHPHPGHNTTHYRWTCRNRPHTKIAKCGNKKEVRCSKERADNTVCGRCGSKANTCSAGVVHPHPGANATHHRWTCRNRPHTRLAKCGNKREVRCSRDKTDRSVCGVCGNINNKCSEGVHHPHPGDNATHHRWTCRNKPHTRLTQCGNKREIQCKWPKASGGGTGNINHPGPSELSSDDITD